MKVLSRVIMTKVTMRGLLLAGTVLCAGIMPFDSSANGVSWIMRLPKALNGLFKITAGGAVGVGAVGCLYYGAQNSWNTFNKANGAVNTAQNLVPSFIPGSKTFNECLAMAFALAAITEEAKKEKLLMTVGPIIISPLLASIAHGLMRDGIRDLKQAVSETN